MKAPAKLPVGRTPICDPSYLRQIDPIWVHNCVPIRFWEEPANRRDYLLWLGGKHRFRWMQDWYKLKLSTAKRKYPQGPIRTYWGGHALAAVQDCFPKYDWCEWLFPRAPIHFWDCPANCRKYLRWLAQRLGFSRLDDWYQMTNLRFLGNCGDSLLRRHGSAAQIVMNLIPRRVWEEWKFRQVAVGFWEQAENRHRYLRWLGRQLGFHRSSDWHRITSDDFNSHHGGALLGRFPIQFILQDFMPELDWRSRDKRRPILVEEILGWMDAYQAKHGRWPTLKSGPIDGTSYTWGAVEASLSCGCHGLPGGSSIARLLAECRGVTPRLGRILCEEEILAWADAHVAQHGKWPRYTSGKISGTNQTWGAVNESLKSGLHGLPGGSSLALLLRQRRGVQGKGGPLSEQQILQWAKAHFAAQGKWPTVKSPAAPKPGRGNSWSAIDMALRVGSRGLPGGSSLFQLLKQHAAAGK